VELLKHLIAIEIGQRRIQQHECGMVEGDLTEVVRHKGHCSLASRRRIQHSNVS
jgi:hypothetical protein